MRVAGFSGTTSSSCVSSCSLICETSDSRVSELAARTDNNGRGLFRVEGVGGKGERWTSWAGEGDARVTDGVKRKRRQLARFWHRRALAHLLRPLLVLSQPGIDSQLGLGLQGAGARG